MATKKTTATGSDAGVRPRGGEVPQVFRLNLEVGDAQQALRFYAELLGIAGRLHRGSRCHFTCGAVTLQIVDVSATGTPRPIAKALYFVVRDLDAVYVRARALGCLSVDDVHGRPGGEIAVRPGGERSFYVEDPWGNPLCFVAEGTVAVD